MPPGDQWQHEVKWDGVRLVVDTRGTRPALFTRTGRDIAGSAPDVVRALTALATEHGDVVLDGELVALDEHGRQDFGRVVGKVHGEAELAADLVVFDVLHAAGRGLLEAPLEQRRAVLDELLAAPVPHLVLPPVYDDGPGLLAASRELGLEGVVSKRRASRYQPGVRSREWVKVVNRVASDYLVVGFRTGAAGELLALLLGRATVPGGDVVYAGSVGSGLVGRTGTALLPRLQRLQRDAPGRPGGVPNAAVAGVTWIRPEMVISVEHHGLTRGGLPRQPVFRGERPDMAAGDVAPLGTP